ncbi:hypothetical protein LUZ60_000376 [Juncus effusus]|nr:hypothetical protein LUZ60_000376 [Juncus effusus]
MGQKGTKLSALRVRFLGKVIKLAMAKPSVSFLTASFLLSFLVGFGYYRIVVTSFLKPELGFVGCRPDGEGSWSIGIYYGKSPFTLSPIELHEKKINVNNSAWPVANPVLTCAHPSLAGFPSNFVADPFLYIQGEMLYMFFETKNTITLKGDIGVAKSSDQGATWQFIGIALQEKWHLSYPFIFTYQNQIYMMPEGNKKGQLRLYRATNFPLKWALEKVLINKPLIDASMIQYNGFYFLFGSDFTRPGTEKNAELEIWYAKTPLGPFIQHKQNPIYKFNKGLGARNAGRLFIYQGNLYRPGQDCKITYGKKVKLFRVEKLTFDEYEEVEVELGFGKNPKKGRNEWNGNRFHHFDAQQLASGDWIAVLDGDRVQSGDATWRSLIGWLSFGFVGVVIWFLGFINGSLSFQSFNYSRVLRFNPRLNLKLRKLFNGFNKHGCYIREKINPSKTWLGLFTFCVFSLICLVTICISVQFLHGKNGAETAYDYNNIYSQFTMVTMTYEARLWNLKVYIEHYSKCESVREIVVIWNKGAPPDESKFDSAVPVRIRVEKVNSLNNRFKPDPLIKTKAVLELDDDIMMTCNDVEKGFRVWRENPRRIVGFYPRLIDGDLVYRNERFARGKNKYNLILTGAAFLDREFAFEKYWSEEAKKGREFVHENFNCEDLLMNYLYANSNYSYNNDNLDFSERIVEYVHPAWAIDTSKLSKVAISRNTQKHYDVRTKCLNKFKELYGPLRSEKVEFGIRKDIWDK